MRISVFSSKELQGTIILMKGLDRELAKQIRRATKDAAETLWQREVAEKVETRLEARVLGQTARVAVSDQNVTLKSASIGRSLSGGLLPSANYSAVEFGAGPAQVTYKATSRKGRPYNVTRNTRAQLRPRNRTGYVVYPAAAGAIPRLASLWVQTTIRTFYELIEKR